MTKKVHIVFEMSMPVVNIKFSTPTDSVRDGPRDGQRISSVSTFIYFLSYLCCSDINYVMVCHQIRGIR